MGWKYDTNRINSFCRLLNNFLPSLAQMCGRAKFWGRSNCNVRWPKLAKVQKFWVLLRIFPVRISVKTSMMIPVVFRGLPPSLEARVWTAYLVSCSHITLSSLPNLTIFCHSWKLHQPYSYTASLNNLRVVNFCPPGCCSHSFLPWFRVAQAIQTTDDELVSAKVDGAAVVGGTSELLLASATGNAIFKHWLKISGISSSA
jgi:hypothetical protein